MGDQQKEGKCKGKQFRWTTPMSTAALQILADEAMKGNKPSSTFKPASFLRASQEVSKQFAITCLPEHVENHLRTIKKDWKIIVTLKNKSGFGWDENMKMITAGQQVYNEEVAAHASHGKFLNKKIELYDEMAIVVGKDIATGAYAKSFSNINETIDLDGIGADDSISMNDDMPISKDTATAAPVSSGKRSHRKRNRVVDEEGDEKLYEHISIMTSAIRELGTIQKKFVDDLYQEVMTIEGYDKFELSRVFDYLVEHERTAAAYMAKSEELKKFWVDNFLAK